MLSPMLATPFNVKKYMYILLSVCDHSCNAHALMTNAAIRCIQYGAYYAFTYMHDIVLCVVNNFQTAMSRTL